MTTHQKVITRKIAHLLLSQSAITPSVKECRAAVVYASTAVVNMGGIIGNCAAEHAEQSEQEEIVATLPDYN